MNKMIDETVIRWFGQIERMRNDRIAKRVYMVGGGGNVWEFV